MGKATIALLAVLSTFVLGCAATVPMTSPSLDSQAKTFQPPQGKANIYVNRKEAFRGAAQTIHVVLDGRIVGAIAPGTYQLHSVDPGEHVLMTSGDFENVAQERVRTEAGRNYYFDVGLGMGWAKAHVNLAAVAEEEGKKDVLASKRAEAFAY